MGTPIVNLDNVVQEVVDDNVAVQETLDAKQVVLDSVSEAQELVDTLAAETESDKTEITQHTQDKINEFDAHIVGADDNFDSNAVQKTQEYDSNAANRLNQYDSNHTTKLGTYNSNDATKLDQYNANHSARITEMNDGYAKRIVDILNTGKTLGSTEVYTPEVSSYTATFLSTVGSTYVYILNGVLLEETTDYTIEADEVTVTLNTEMSPSDTLLQVDTELLALVAVQAGGLYASQINQPNGVAGLDGNGLIAAAQLPSYVDDVLEVATYADLPATGESDKIYLVVADENNGGDTSSYRWATTVYALVSDTLTAADIEALYEGILGTEKYTTAEQTKVGYLTVTQDIDLDAQKALSESMQQRYLDTNEPTGFIREFRETNGVMELAVGQGVTGYSNPDLGFTNHDFVNYKVVRIDWNGVTTIHDTATFYDGTVCADRTFRIMPVVYTGTIDIINEETDALENRADTRDTSIAGGEYYSIYVEGIKSDVVNGQSIEFPNTSGLQFVYHTTNGLLELAQTFSFEYFEDLPITATVYGNNIDFQLVNLGDERHGIQMDGFTHRYLHFTQGTQYISGMELNGIVAGGTTYTSISSGKAYDEDIYLRFPTQTYAPHLYLRWDATSSKNVWRLEEDATDIAFLIGGEAQYNINNAGQWDLESLHTNPQADYGIVIFVGTNNREFPYVKMLGQNAYANVTNARADIENAVSSLVTAGLPSPEFLPIWAVIIDKNGQAQTLSDGTTQLDLRTATLSGVGTTSLPSTYHQDLLGRDVADSHPATAISVTPNGNLSSINVQLALEELQSDIDIINDGGPW